MALSYWPTSMHKAALLFNRCAKTLREFWGDDEERRVEGFVIVEKEFDSTGDDFRLCFYL